MDLSPKRFHDLEELIKTRNSFHEWIREGKVQTQLFNQDIEKMSVPFLSNVVKKEDEILDKLKSTLKPDDSNINVVDDFLPPEYGDFYSDFNPLAVNFKIYNKKHPKLIPTLIVANQYGHNFTGITLNGAKFVFY